ncbi:MAG: hypothetical protein EP330_06290 [Deltaproteobacteria bacterium]|nr:MAG: hypothetical protein EP330_06290 [Deltaproteobacteria bacterium]
MTTRSAWVSYRLKTKPQPGDPVVGSFGGHPRGVRANQWPRCAVCGNPMCHMAQIMAGPWLDLGGATRMSVFICHATGGRCEDWDPWKGANRVVLHPTDDDSLYDGPPTVRVYRRKLLTVEQPLDELALMRRVKHEGLAMSDALDELRHDKIGGGAVWLHGDQTPQSPTGQGPMRLALQMTTNLVSFDITPGGMAYVFVDPFANDGVGRLLWQGGS